MKIAELLGASILLRGGARMSGGVSKVLVEGFDALAGEKVRTDPAAPAGGRETVHEAQVLARMPVHAAMERFMTFAEEELTEWRKTAAHTTHDGAAAATYAGRIAVPVTLQPLTYWARMARDAERRRRGGRLCLQARVTYRYSVRFGLHPRGPRLTLATVRTTEAVDPDMSCGYDLARHFAVPSMPGGFGRIGGRFLAGLG